MNYLIDKRLQEETTANNIKGVVLNSMTAAYGLHFGLLTPEELFLRLQEMDLTKEEWLSSYIQLTNFIKFLTELKDACKDTIYSYAGTGEKIDGFTVEIQKRNDIQYKECPLYVSETAKAKERENQLKELIKTATIQQTTVVDPVTGEYLDAVTEIPNNVLVVKKGTK